MPLIYCKVELNFRWIKHCILFVLGAANTDNDDSPNFNHILFTIQVTKLYVPVVTLSAKRQSNTIKTL